MIYTLTLNPAIDYVVHVEDVIPGSIMRSRAENVFFGGKGINVSTVLREHGVASVAMGFLAGFTGHAIAQGLAEKGISQDFVFLDSGFTRINIKLRSQVRTHPETDINGSGPQISEEDLQALLAKLACLQDGDTLVLAGSIPACMPKDTYEQILKHLQGKDVRFVVDAEGKLLSNTLKYRPFLIKPNTDELGELFGVRIDSKEDAACYAKKLQQQGARNVLVSMGGDGALLVDETGCVHQREAFSGKVVNTVGAGDSTVAGFLAGYEQTKDYAYSLKLGCASGSASAFSEGLATKEAIYALLNG